MRLFRRNPYGTGLCGRSDAFWLSYLEQPNRARLTQPGASRKVSNPVTGPAVAQRTGCKIGVREKEAKRANGVLAPVAESGRHGIGVESLTAWLEAMTSYERLNPFAAVFLAHCDHYRRRESWDASE